MPLARTASPTPNSRGRNPAANGSAAPVSTGEKKDTSGVVLSSGRPNKQAYEKESYRIDADVNTLQAKLSAVKEKISATQSSANDERKNMLRGELDDLKKQQSSKKLNRGQLLDQVKSLHDTLEKKIKEFQAQKSKVQFKTVSDIDNRIATLEQQIESGNMKLADEKRALQEISQIKRTRRIVENFQAEQDVIDATRQEIDKLKKQLDDPEAKALSDRFEAIKAELDEIKKEEDEAYAGRSKLFAERDNLNNQIKALLAERQERKQAYRDANDKYWTKVNEDRARRAEKQRAQRAEEEKRKKLEIAQQMRDEASAPAFQTDIETCQTLIDFFSGRSSATPVPRSNNSPFARAKVTGVPKLELRQVDAVPEGAVVRKKKGEDEGNYFVGGTPKKGKKGDVAKVANESTEDSLAAPSSAAEKLHIPLGNLVALLKLSISVPESQTDIPRVISDLNTKKAWYEVNQPRVTKENIDKAEAEIARLTEQDPKPVIETPGETETTKSPFSVDSGSKEEEEDTA